MHRMVLTVMPATTQTDMSVSVSLGSQTMQPKFMPVLEMCIENGIKLGLARAHKHDDEPSAKQIEEEIFRCITNEIYEWFDVSE